MDLCSGEKLLYSRIQLCILMVAFSNDLSLTGSSIKLFNLGAQQSMMNRRQKIQVSLRTLIPSYGMKKLSVISSGIVEYFFFFRTVICIRYSFFLKNNK